MPIRDWPVVAMHGMIMTREFHCALWMAAMLPVSGWAQAWPAKPVRIIVPFAPGGGTDVLARLLAPRLTSALGQQVVVENKPGAASVIGTELVARSTPDGYTLLMVDSSILVNPGLQSKLPYDTVRDLVPVIHAAAAPVMLVVHASLPARSVPELVALARSRPGALAYASGGNGTSTHLAGEQFKLLAGVDIVHIPYKGSAPAASDVIAGQVPMIFAGINTARQHVEVGRLRALAITGEKRHAVMPNVPTFTEAGMSGVDCGTDWGMLAPAGTPLEAVQRMNAEMDRALRIPEVLNRTTELGYEVIQVQPWSQVGPR